MTAPSRKPTRKVGRAGVAGAATTVLMALAAALGYPLPLEVATSIVTLVMFAVAYFTEDR